MSSYPNLVNARKVESVAMGELVRELGASSLLIISAFCVMQLIGGNERSENTLLSIWYIVCGMGALVCFISALIVSRPIKMEFWSVLMRVGGIILFVVGVMYLFQTVNSDSVSKSLHYKIGAGISIIGFVSFLAGCVISIVRGTSIVFSFIFSDL